MTAEPVVSSRVAASRRSRATERGASQARNSRVLCRHFSLFGGAHSFSGQGWQLEAPGGGGKLKMESK
jgi:hypothetical protein